MLKLQLQEACLSLLSLGYSALLAPQPAVRKSSHQTLLVRPSQLVAGTL